MTAQYAFYFDSSACSGCKACQVACKDRNGLEAGRLWRRVYEVSGGEWAQAGDAWQTSAFAYNLSIACNHCAQPVCAEVCPSRAIYKRDDGLVLIDERRCLGCQYCSWACPYGALQYHPANGRMTKCTFCVEDLDAGLPPACVTACPLRVLDFGEQAELATRQAEQRHAAPLPEPTLTEPALLLSAHKDAESDDGAAQVANREEVIRKCASDERSLILFTISLQTAVGAFLVLGALHTWLARQAGMMGAGLLSDKITLAIGPLAGLGLLASFFHLGRPINAWRAFANLRSSWLSREVLFAALFTLIGGAFAGLQWFKIGPPEVRYAVAGLAALCGMALVYCMARVYTQKTIPEWNTWITLLAFFISPALLGGLAVSAALPLIFANTWPTSVRSFHLFLSPLRCIGLGACALLVLELAIVLLEMARRPEADKLVTPKFGALYQPQPQKVMLSLRLVLICLSILAVALLLYRVSAWPHPEAAIPPAWMALGLASGSEITGRIYFYKKRKRVM